MWLGFTARTLFLFKDIIIRGLKAYGKLSNDHSFKFQIFKQATLFFSRNTPNLSKVIPVMDYINKHLASGSVMESYSPSIWASMLIGKKLLNKYYNMTDHSEVYRITMGMLFLLHVHCDLFFDSSRSKTQA